MQIGIDCRLPTYQMGGISQYTIHLIQALGKVAGDERFTIFHMKREGRSFLPNSDRRFSRSDLLTPCHHRLERHTLIAELARHSLDVFHSPDFIPPIAGAYRKIITVHDLTFLYYPEFLTDASRRYYSDQIEWAVTKANHILADSEATRIDLIRLLGVAPAKVTTIHLAANPIFGSHHPAEDVARTLQELGLKRGFILTVGTLEPRKNLPVLFQAYRRLRREYHIEVPLILVGGKGWIYEEIFKVISELDLTGSVLHLSGITDLQLAHLYRSAGVLAFPSVYEGFGLPALEAMHSGCPVVASNRGSLPEVVEDAALSIEPDDVDAWVESIFQVLSEKEIATSLVKTGFQQARKFTWEKTATATLEIYRSEGAA